MSDEMRRAREFAEWMLGYRPYPAHNYPPKKEEPKPPPPDSALPDPQEDTR